MRKVLKWLIILSCSLVTLFVLFGMFLPSDSYVQRSVVINKPVENVYSVVSDLKKFPQWQPWDKPEYNVQFRFADEQEGVADRLFWQSSVADMTYGNITVENKKKNESVLTRVIISGNTLFNLNFNLNPIDERSTEVIWSFQANHGSNIFARYFALAYENKVIADFERGLGNLKSFVEQ